MILYLGNDVELRDFNQLVFDIIYVSNHPLAALWLSTVLYAVEVKFTKDNIVSVPPDRCIYNDPFTTALDVFNRHNVPAVQFTNPQFRGCGPMDINYTVYVIKTSVLPAKIIAAKRFGEEPSADSVFKWALNYDPRVKNLLMRPPNDPIPRS